MCSEDRHTLKVNSADIHDQNRVSQVTMVCRAGVMDEAVNNLLLPHYIDCKDQGAAVRDNRLCTTQHPSLLILQLGLAKAKLVAPCLFFLSLSHCLFQGLQRHED